MMRSAWQARGVLMLMEECALKVRGESQAKEGRQGLWSTNPALQPSMISSAERERR